MGGSVIMAAVVCPIYEAKFLKEIKPHLQEHSPNTSTLLYIRRLCITLIINNGIQMLFRYRSTLPFSDPKSPLWRIQHQIRPFSTPWCRNRRQDPRFKSRSRCRHLLVCHPLLPHHRLLLPLHPQRFHVSRKARLA